MKKLKRITNKVLENCKVCYFASGVFRGSASGSFESLSDAIHYGNYQDSRMPYDTVEIFSNTEQFYGGWRVIRGNYDGSISGYKRID